MTVTTVDKDIIEQGLIQLREDDLSKRVLVPLFTKIFGCKVEFVGGRTEKGRDIIIHNEDELGDPQIICVQVKKISPSENSSKSSNLQQLINQLSQISSEGVTSTRTGEKLKVSRVFFVTPYIFEQRPADSHQGALHKVINEMNVRMIDGSELSALISRHYPALLSVIIEDKQLIKETIRSSLSNDILMKACHLEETKDISDIYCDISIVPGSKTMSNLVSHEFTVGENNHINLPLHRIGEFYQLCETLRSEFNINILSSDEFENLENQATKVDTDSKKLEENQKYIDQAIGPTSRIIELDYKQLNPNKYTYRELRSAKIVGRYIAYLNDLKPEDKRDIDGNSLEEVICDLKSRMELLLQALKTREQDLEKSLRSSQSFSLMLTEYQHETKRMKKELAASPITSSSELALFLDQYLSLSKLASLSKTFEDKIEIGEEDIGSEIYNALGWSIGDVFDTGKSILLLGDAGSGKTTNLQYYTRSKLKSNDEELIVFSTLHMIASRAVKIRSNKIIDGLSEYLAELSESLSIFTLTDHLKNNRSLLVLDSIDEAIVEYPWVIESLLEYCNQFPNSQVIVSSRYTAPGLAKLPFIELSLLPFNTAQKKEFFTKWFKGDGQKSDQIMEHLSANPQLSEVVTNPLSATILCVLTEYEVPLPTSEAALYKKRFELLSGVFDQFKGVRRSNFEPEVLVEWASILAFEIHVAGQRSFSLNRALAIFTESNRDERGSKYLEELVQSLVSPSEILVPSSEGEYCFGHLRFQEYLAAVELQKRRNQPFSRY